MTTFDAASDQSGRTASYISRHVAIVFFGFLAIAAPLPVLAIFVHDTLGFGPGIVGWIIGAQSIATVLTRHFAGGIADRHGPRRAVFLGLPLAALAGFFYLAAALSASSGASRLGILLPGRLLLGLAESLFLTGTMSWGITVLGSKRAGTVMSWQGIGMYASLGLGAPLGLAVFERGGMTGVAAITILLPLVALAIAAPGSAVPGTGGERVPFHRVVSLIWRQGCVLTLATVPFAAMATFLVLDYAAKGWSGAGTALAGFGAGYILVRLIGSGLPDRFGGSRTAAWSLAVETLGQAILWLSPTPSLALVGAVLTGLGFSLVFPAMGVDATRRVPAHLRGRAVGNFIAFFDIAVGLTGPVAGLLVAPLGYEAIFAIGTLASALAIAILAAAPRTGDERPAHLESN